MDCLCYQQNVRSCSCVYTLADTHGTRTTIAACFVAVPPWPEACPRESNTASQGTLQRHRSMASISFGQGINLTATANITGLPKYSTVQ